MKSSNQDVRAAWIPVKTGIQAARAKFQHSRE